jgi:hypothetical protein
MHEKFKAKPQTLGILQHHQFQHLHYKPNITRSFTSATDFDITRFCILYVKYQLLHTCEPSQTCHSGNRQLVAMYQTIH